MLKEAVCSASQLFLSRALAIASFHWFMLSFAARHNIIAAITTASRRNRTVHRVVRGTLPSRGARSRSEPVPIAWSRPSGNTTATAGKSRFRTFALAVRGNRRESVTLRSLSDLYGMARETRKKKRSGKRSGRRICGWSECGRGCPRKRYEAMNEVLDSITSTANVEHLCRRY